VGEIRWLNDDESRAWRGYLRMGVVLHAQLARELTSETGLSYPIMTCCLIYPKLPASGCG
jgi:hypothetical protein